MQRMRTDASVSIVISSGNDVCELEEVCAVPGVETVGLRGIKENS